MLSASLFSFSQSSAAELFRFSEQDADRFALEYIKNRNLSKEMLMERSARKLAKIPIAERQLRNAVFIEHIQKFAPEWLSEFSAMDRAFALADGDYLSILAAGNWQEPEQHECTSWIVMPDLSKDRNLLIHKNRDATETGHAPTWVKRPGKIGWLGSCSLFFPFPVLGINEKGLAVMMNNADAYDGWNNSGLSTAMIARILLENCSTCQEAASLLDKIIAEKAYYHGKTGSIFFFADTKVAGVYELSARKSAYSPFSFGYAIRANTWELPGMVALSRKTSEQVAADDFREYQVRDALMAAVKRGGVEIEDCFAASRLRGGDVSEQRFPVCWENSTAFATCEIDREFSELHTLYLASGPSRNTVVIPIPLGANALPLKMFSGEWTALAQGFKRKAGIDHKKLTEIEKIEKELCADYRTVKEEARLLLRKGKKQEAATLLQKTLAKQFLQAEDAYAKIIK